MRFGVLGPLEVHGDDGPVALPAGRTRSLLGVLLINAGRVVPSDRIIDAVWGEAIPSDPANALQQNVARLRRLLSAGGSRPLLTEPPGYRLDMTGQHIDASEFEDGLERARDLLELANAAGAARELDAALGLWRGAAYADFLYDDFATAERERLDARYLDARELLIDARMDVEGPAAVVADLEALVLEHPYRERLRAQLMRALYGAGRQADSLAAYQDARRVLGENLGIEPSPELRDLEEQILLQDPQLTPAASQHPHNLPAPTSSLVGRQSELSAINDTLGEARLVTLLGPGGSGKTRLALAAAHAARERFAGGTWLVRLDDLRDPALILNEIAGEVGMPEDPERDMVDTLTRFIRDTSMLLVLDNCEHLIDEVAATTGALLAACPNLTVLATSQQALRINGERRFPIEPLPLPGATGSPFEDLGAVPAIELFVQRARAVNPDFAPTPSDLVAIANLVTALDGLPLAIELAAARSNVLAPQELAARLIDRFTILETQARDVPDRQRTLHNAVSWSFDLLDPDERSFFASLSVCAGSFDIDAAAALTESPRAIDLMGRLVDRSLVMPARPAGGRSRYRVLETLRQFGDEALESARALAATKQRHLEHFGALARDLDDELRTARQIEAFDRTLADQDNFRAAMQWGIDSSDIESAVMIAGHLGTFWDWHGDLSEGALWSSRIRSTAPQDDLPGLSLLLLWQAYYEQELGNPDTAFDVARTAVGIAEQYGDARDLSGSYSIPAMLHRLRGDLDAAQDYNDRVRTIGQANDRDWFVAWADNHAALVLLARGELAAADVAAAESLRGFNALGDRRATGWALTVQAQIALERGESAAACHTSLEAAELSTAVGDGRNAGWALEIAAEAARQGGHDDEAREHEARAAALLDARGMPTSPWRR